MRDVIAPSAHRADRGVPDLGELAAISAELETRPATSAIAWAHERFGDGLVLAASFQDCVLVDLTMHVARDVAVVFLDTGYHFAETLWYVDRIRRRYDLDLTVVRPADTAPADGWLDDADACCQARKVEPLRRALAGRDAWMSGLRRDESPARARAPIASYDVGRGVVKVNPIAGWSEADVVSYAREHDLPAHPLAERGYPSIGCWPCTRPVADGDDPRAGRWAGTDKQECGLHA